MTDIKDIVEGFTPYVIEGYQEYGLMVVHLEYCYICKKTMIYPPPRRNYENSTFPHFNRINFKTQILRAGWVEMSNEKVDDHTVCVECVQAGKLTIFCTLCEQNWPSDQIYDYIGYPPEYLCKTCYSTVSAQRWFEAVTRLREIHKYDFD